MFTLYVDGDRKEYLEDGEFRVQVEGPAADGMGVDTICPVCSQEIDEDGEGHAEHRETFEMDGGGAAARVSETLTVLDDEDCANYQSDPATWEENNRVEAWCNSASIDVRDDEVSVGISIGDPRGALSMTVRRVVDEEGNARFYLFVPHHEDTMPHVHLEDLGGGRYEIV